MKWRKWNNIIHRDLGYLCVGLTLIYIISGIAVNHTGDWNPSFSAEIVQDNIGPIYREALVLTPPEIQNILSRLNLPLEYRNSFQSDPQNIRIFKNGNTISVNLDNGSVIQERVKKRFLVFEFNYLHLNHAKKLWTLMADVYAITLGIVTITGLFVLRGKKGIKGRGAWLTSIGILIPALCLFAYL